MNLSPNRCILYCL